MHQRYFWKQLPVPIKRLRPWLLLSVTLHAAIFVAPLLPSPPPLPEPEDTVGLAPKPPSPSTSPLPLPTVTASTPAPGPVPQSPPSRRVLPPQAPLVVARSTPPKTAAPAVTLSSPASPSPSPSPAATVASPSPLPSTPLPVAASPTSEPPSPYATFPHLESTTAGCGDRENCWQSADTQWRSLARTLEQNLQNQGYSLTQLDLETDTGVRVYRVAKAGEPEYYLNLISTFQGTVYLISEQLMTAVEIRQAAESQPGG